MQLNLQKINFSNEKIIDNYIKTFEENKIENANLK